jgi:phosphatidylglycerophosphate synthase
MSNREPHRTRFLTAAWAFVAVNLLGTVIGGLAALPASNGQHGNVHDVGSQAIYGNGTATSPPLLLTAILCLSVLAATRSSGRLGKLGAVLAFLFAGFYVSAGELGELTTSTSPLIGAKWNLVLALGALGIAIATLTLLTGLEGALAALARRRSRRRTPGAPAAQACD